jgi:NAD(P)H dehydrogenase (quinone)
MKTPKILATAATGRTGYPVVKQLIEKGFPVRALVRQRDERSDRLESLGAEVVVGDFFDVPSLRAAMTGIQRAYFCYPPADRLLEASTNFAVVAKEAGLESVVNMSQIIAREGHPSPLSRQHWLAEHIFDWAGVGATHIRPTFFAEMAQITNGHNIAADGKLYLPHGTKKHAPVTVKDIARVVVGILTNPETHVGKTYTITGEKPLSQTEIAETIGNVIGKPMEYVDIPMEHWQQRAQAMGFPSFLVEHLSRVGEDYQNGLFDVVTDVVEKVGGQLPQTFEDYVRENSEAFKGSVAAVH